MTELEKLKKELKEFTEEANKKMAEIEEMFKSLEAKENDEITFDDGERYYSVDSCVDVVGNDFDFDNYNAKMRLYVKNAFKTEEQAECVADKFKFLLKLYDYHLRYDKDFEPNWDNAKQPKYYIHFDTQIKKYCLYYHFVDKDNTVYFSSEEIAQKVCDELNEEIKNDRLDR